MKAHNGPDSTRCKTPKGGPCPSPSAIEHSPTRDNHHNSIRFFDPYKRSTITDKSSLARLDILAPHCIQTLRAPSSVLTPASHHPLAPCWGIL